MRRGGGGGDCRGGCGGRRRGGGGRRRGRRGRRGGGRRGGGRCGRGRCCCRGGRGGRGGRGRGRRGGGRGGCDGRCCCGAGCGVWAPVLPGFGALAILLVFIRQIVLEMAFCFCCNIRKSCTSVSSSAQLLAFFTRTCDSTIITL